LKVITPTFFDEDAERVSCKAPIVVQGGNVRRSETNRYQLNKFDVWFMCMSYAEWGYNQLLTMGASPQEARTVLPNSLKTTLKIKANIREWRHIFKLRAVNTGAHPQIRELMIPALRECAEKWPVLFGDLAEEIK